MNDVITTILSVLLITYPIVILLYARSLNKLVKLSKTTSNTIFGHLYINLSQIISDITFMKTLWTGKRIQHTENKKLKRLLVTTRLQLIFTVYFGLITLLFFVLNELVSAS